MQDHLDPSIGQTEIVAMKKEIHRMELRYEQLRKKQEEMIKDMERSVFKRETIQLKYLPKVEKKNAQDKCKLQLTLIFFSISRKAFSPDCKFKTNFKAYHREYNAAGLFD
jgi:hypothetical protein